MKKWYSSKEIWVNFVSLVAIVIQSQTSYIIDPATQTVIVNVILTFLRLFVTKEPIVFGSQENS